LLQTTSMDKPDLPKPEPNLPPPSSLQAPGKASRTVGRIAVALGIPLILIGLIVAHLRTVAPVQIGQVAPSFSLTTLQGQPFTLREPEDRLVVLNFFATWCGPCQSEMPQLAAFANAHRERAALVLIDRGEGAALVEPFIHSFQFQDATVVLDHTDQLAAPYGVTGQPETFIISPDGRVRAHWLGPVTTAELDAALARWGPHRV